MSPIQRNDRFRRCLAFGAVCKNAGVRCCDGLACGSGQGGQDDVACFVPAGGPCRSTTECVFGSACEDGICVAEPRPTPAPDCAVCASGGPFATIEAAIAAATVGNEIVTVAADTYRPVAMAATESEGGSFLEIVRPLTLKSCAPGERVTVVCPIGIGLPDNCIRAVGPGAAVTVEGIAIEARVESENAGFAAFNGASLTLRDVTASDFANGVYGWSGTNVPSTVATQGSVRIANSPPFKSHSYGTSASNTAQITVGGQLSVTNAAFGLNAQSAPNLTCAPGSSYTSVLVDTRCNHAFVGCTC